MNRRDKTIINMMDIATEATHECERMQRKLTLFETFARNVAKTTMPNLLTFPDDYGLDDIEDAVSNLRAKLERYENAVEAESMRLSRVSFDGVRVTEHTAIEIQGDYYTPGKFPPEGLTIAAPAEAQEEQNG